MTTISVVVFATPGMTHLTQCLESVRWADGVAVRHLGKGGDIVSTEEVKGPSSGSGTDWSLCLWGEERVAEELREELQAARRGSGLTTASSYRIPIRSRLLSGWAEGSLWGPSPALRLSRGTTMRPAGWWNAAEGNSSGRAGLLRGWIEDYSLAELSAGVDWVNRYSGLWAAQAQAKNLSFSSASGVIGSLGVFVRLLWMNGVFSNGLPGLTLSALAAYAHLLGGAKLWEAKNVDSAGKGKG